MNASSNKWMTNKGELIVKIPLTPELLDALRYKRDIGVYVDDSRTLSKLQRNKIYALIGEISDYTGYTVGDMLEIMKLRFLKTENSGEWFSLSENKEIALSKDGAIRFITFLINYCIENNIPCKDRLLDHTEEIGKYLYACIMNKVCVICGKKADLHHFDAIGMGRDRQTINHVGMNAIALCREHHTQAHAMGKQTFRTKYKVYGIKIDQAIAKVWEL